MTSVLVPLGILAYLAAGYGLATALWSAWSQADPKRLAAKILLPVTSRLEPSALGVCLEDDAYPGTLADIGEHGEGLSSYLLATAVLWPLKAAWILACNAFLLAVGICYLLIVGPTRLVQRMLRPKPRKNAAPTP